MTSNIGSVYLLEGIEEGVIPEDVRARVMGELREHFRPEFLNRVDETSCSSRSPSRKSSTSSTCRSMTCRTASWTGVSSSEVTEGAVELIAREGYDPVYGARPLRRFIQREVETRIGRALLSGQILDGATITLDAEGDELVVIWRNPGGVARDARRRIIEFFDIHLRP